jgi:thiol-disulfide isomerase/thioredoxin
MEKVNLGRTDLPIEIILEYLESLKQIYTAEVCLLSLFRNHHPQANPNPSRMTCSCTTAITCEFWITPASDYISNGNSSNDFAMFLVGKKIPNHITSLPKRVLETPFGQMLKPQLDAAMRPMTQARATPQQIPRPAASINGTAKPTLGVVHNVTRLGDLETLLNSASNSCSAIFFTSSTCAPCKICYPAYDSLASEAGEKAVLIKVDINNAHEIASKYGVRATPTFMTFLKGKKEEEWSGADPARLLGSIRLLIISAFPPHPHENFRLPQLHRTSLRPITYKKMPPLDKLIGKLGAYGNNSIVPAMKKFIEAIHGSPSQESPLPSLPAFAKFLQSSITALPPSDLFAAYDLFRLAVADARVSAFFAEEADTRTILELVSHVNKLGASAPYNLRIVSLHVACNLLASPLSTHVLLANQPVAKQFVELVTTSLLDEAHLNVRIASASLAFNIAVANHKPRMEKGKDVLQSSEQVELVAGILEGIGREEESKEVVTGLARALGFLAYKAEVGGELLDLCTALEAGNTVLGKEKLSEGDAVLKEVGGVLLK